MNEEKIKNTDLLMRDPEETKLTEYRSIFYRFLAKSDSVTKVFNKTAVIEIGDIYALNDRVCEKLCHYEEAGFIIQINVKFSNGKTRTFPDWNSFYGHKWYEPESINNINIVWEFNAIFPGLKEPQRHTLMVKLSNGLRPEEIINLIFTGKIEEIEEMDNNLFPIVARVDFVDRVLGDELLNIVGEWVKTLKEPVIQKSRFMLCLKKNKGKISSIVNLITNMSIMLSSVYILGGYISHLGFSKIMDITNQQFVHIVYATFTCCAVWVFGRKIVGTLTDFLFEKLRVYGENALFDITKGDQNKQNKIKRQEETNKIVILGNLILTIIINVGCGLIANFLS